MSRLSVSPDVQAEAKSVAGRLGMHSRTGGPALHLWRRINKQRPPSRWIISYNWVLSVGLACDQSWNDVKMLPLPLRVSISPVRDASSRLELDWRYIGGWLRLKSCLVRIRTIWLRAVTTSGLRISRPATWSSTGYREQLIDWLRGVIVTAAAADSQTLINAVTK